MQQDAADVLLIYLLNHLHNWPPATGPNSLSSANKETVRLAAALSSNLVAEPVYPV